MKNLGELTIGDIIYKIHWEGGHIGYIDKYKVNRIYDVKIGRIIHYGDDDYFITLKFDELNEPIQTDYYIEQFCSDKHKLTELIEYDRDECLFRYKEILNSI